MTDKLKPSTILRTLLQRHCPGERFLTQECMEKMIKTPDAVSDDQPQGASVSMYIVNISANPDSTSKLFSHYITVHADSPESATQNAWMLFNHETLLNDKLRTKVSALTVSGSMKDGLASLHTNRCVKLVPPYYYKE